MTMDNVSLLAGEPLIDAFLKYLQKKPNGRKDICAQLLSGGQDGMGNRLANEFRRFCQTLVDLRCYEPILAFTARVINECAACDMKGLRQVLSEIRVRQDYFLADLCQDFYRDLHRNYRTEKAWRYLHALHPQKDLFDGISESERIHPWSEPLKRGTLIETISSRVFQRPMEIGTFQKADIDFLAETVRRKEKEKYRLLRAEIEQHNREVDACREIEKAPVLEYRVLPEFDWLECDRELPGMLMPFLKGAEFTSRPDIFYHMLERYLLPCAALIPWEQDPDLKLGIMARIVSACAERQYFMMVSQFPFLNDSDSGINWKDSIMDTLYREALGAEVEKGEYRYCSDEFITFCREHRMLGRYWADIMGNGGSVLRGAMDPHYYSYYMLLAPLMLCFAGDEELAVQFLLRHYNDIGPNERRNPLAQILLVRCIRACRRPEPASILYGEFNYELDRIEREKFTVIDKMTKMVRFLLDAKEYIRRADAHTLKSMESWYDILYADGKIDAFTTRVEEMLRRGKIPSEPDCRMLHDYVAAFSYKSGVHLGQLGLPRYDGYDILGGALSATLVKQGQGYQDWFQEIRLYYSSVRQAENRKDANICLQRHIVSLQRNVVEESQRRIAARKKKLPQQMTTEAGEQFLREIERDADNLVSMLRGYSLGRLEMEQQIEQSHVAFVSRFASPNQDLFLKLPAQLRTDVRKYLITSTMILRTMMARDDADLDYSCAVISMTKALELIMDHINVEVGASASTLNDRINLLRRNSAARRQVQNIVDFSRLSALCSIDVHVLVNNGRRGTTEAVVHFGTDVGDNQDRLAAALHDIRSRYRNMVAHKDIVSRETAMECYERLLGSGNLFWILLFILK